MPGVVLGRHQSNRRSLSSSAVIGIALVAGEHGGEIGPAVQRDHQQMSRDKGEEAAHRREMPDAGEPEAAEQCEQEAQLYRLDFAAL